MSSLTPLVSVLKFKSLNARLLDTEFDTFISRMWKVVGRKKILKLLCTPFLKESDVAPVVDKGGFNLLDTMTTITSDIIQNRDTYSNPRIKPNINNMPSCLVGTIAAFLDQWSYIPFSRTNRKIYVDCNSPNRLQKLSLERCTDYSTVPLKQFPQLKWLKFNLKNICGFKVVDGHRFGFCNQLETMIIHGTGSNISDINLLTNDSSRCFSSIRCLLLEWFRGSSKLDPASVIQILSKFDKLAHFKTHAVQTQAPLSLRPLSLVCPEIKEFMSLRSILTEQILEAWKGRIDTLTIDKLRFKFSNYDISAVKRLCFVCLDISKIDSLLNSSKSLREISWIPNDYTPPRPSFNVQQVQNVTKRCIVDQVSLEYLYVSTRGHFGAICNGIHNGLYFTKKRKRKQFEIALHVDVREISNTEEFVCYIAKIINVIGMSKIEEWIICVNAYRGSNDDQYFDWTPMKVAITDLLRSLQMNVQLAKGTETGFVLKNGYKMKRHNMWWKKDGLFAYY